MRIGIGFWKDTIMTKVDGPQIQNSGMRVMPPLAQFAGALPPRPDWFARAVDMPFETVPFTHDGADIELMVWGPRGAPGLMLVHGNRAHGHWWSPVAAVLSDQFRVAVPSLSGFGNSGWRKAYSIEAYGDEIMAGARAAGLYDHGRPVLASHSFGSGPVISAAERNWRDLAGMIVCDTQLIPNASKPDVQLATTQKVYATREDALARFRLVPPQDCENLYYVDWIARKGLREVGAEVAGGPGWVWSFDPGQWNLVEWFDKWPPLTRIGCPMAFLFGELSPAVDAEARAALRAHVGPDPAIEIIAGARHHLMLDQPLAVADALRRHAGAMHGRA